jgi:nicotinamide mononucleotide transporter
MAVKKLESWAIWFLVDIVSAPFYFITVGWATGILYFVFIFTAVMGWIEWKKSAASANLELSHKDTKDTK